MMASHRQCDGRVALARGTEQSDMNTGIRAVITGAVASALIACVVHAQTTPFARAGSPPDLSGFWELSLDSRKVPSANLLSSVTPAMIEDRATRDAHALRWCNIVGMPALMDSGRPLDIRQGGNAIIIVPEVQTAPPRYLYTWRKEHISEDTFDPTTFGDSIAHWEGDTLVVDTVGFHPDRGITRIPGGGYRTARRTSSNATGSSTTATYCRSRSPGPIRRYSGRRTLTSSGTTSCRQVTKRGRGSPAIRTTKSGRDFWRGTRRQRQHVEEQHNATRSSTSAIRGDRRARCRHNRSTFCAAGGSSAGAPDRRRMGAYGYRWLRQLRWPRRVAAAGPTHA